MGKRKNRPGRGFYMDSVVLQNLVIDSFTMRPCKLEKKYSCSHGVATRALRKAKELELTENAIRQMTPKEFVEQWYRREVRGKVNGVLCNYLQPDYSKMQEMYAASRKHNGSGTEIKCELTRAEVVDMVYFSKENRAKAEHENLALYTSKSVVREWGKIIKTKIPVSFRKHYEMGGEIQVDFTGVTIAYGDEAEGKRAQIIVLTLPASRYMTVRAIVSQKLEDVIPAIVDCLKELGGVPEMMVVDNFKGAMIKASVYGGIPNENMLALCNFFGMQLHACRPHKPKDKGTVEASVKIITRSVLARVNYELVNGDLKFNTVSELNDYIQPMVAAINNHEVRALKRSRKDLFEEERKYLKQVANWDYYSAERNVQTVPATSVIEIDKHQYALPPKWVGNSVVVEKQPKLIRFIANNCVIASYERRDEITGLSAQPSFYTDEKLLSYERYQLPQDSFLLEWAQAEGKSVREWASLMLKRCARKSEAIKQIVKVLSLPKGCKNLYSTLEHAVAYSRCYLGYPAITDKIIKAFNDTNPKYDGTWDEVYNLSNYDSLCKDVIFCRIPSLHWPTAHKAPPTHVGTGEYLQGSEELKKRYANVSAAMKETTSPTTSSNNNYSNSNSNDDTHRDEKNEAC